MDGGKGQVNVALNGGTTAVPRRTVGGTSPTLDTPKIQIAKVKEQSIKIPDFFKK